MKAVTVIPGVPESLRLREVPKPSPGPGQVLLKPLKVGVCGTDKEIIEGKYGKAPEGSDYLILGHEALAEVAELGPGVDNVSVGDLVVPTVRRPLNCGLPVDYCPVGRYLEHGIWGLHGHAAEFSVTDAAYLVKVPKEAADVAVLTEPLSVVEKGVELGLGLYQSRLGRRPETALVLGAGPVGLLASMVLRLAGLSVTAVATRPPDSLKARLVKELGGTYVDAAHEKISGTYDLVIEATGAPAMALEGVEVLGPGGVEVLLGVYPPGGRLDDVGRLLTEAVLNNKLVVGSVNAGLRHFEAALRHLREADERFGGWPRRLITKTASLGNYQEAYSWTHDDVKTVLSME
ncbi:MAG: glucose 1-dehydrogenase [Thermoproteus sp.]|jgi:threonine dehydrogenase-like Zn-dependent dehydrogenase|uniref:glucose 1-dehydrogenase n=1 Tax=Thermoproteus sp. CP80 TaxID=1650659 RepID=UPI00074AF827|nr:glucose 1-dehydrogenase [Thermoproteus sp. CP80]KUO87230.1 MAG: glucose dehydrogenase [Thermoproteus sp. JCHS_4]MDT7870222.1 glucose 1-dehydrogenase [Thermoproteus sp.]MDT7882824.1 glucose 1-dehydrogenase [Thermoproteus sp.]PLC67250.1 glucose dehydrogenase [Thermoproteus sp. CP80]